MSEQQDRERFDKRISDLVAHKTPDEMARELLNLQDAQARNAEESQRAAEQQQAEPAADPALEPAENPLEDSSADKHGKHRKR